jgi:hypothetical protein
MVLILAGRVQSIGAGIRDRMLIMSAAELIQYVKALSKEEQRKFFHAVSVLEGEISRKDTEQRADHTEWPDVEARAKRIFGERQLPNLVLLDRAETEF